MKYVIENLYSKFSTGKVIKFGLTIINDSLSEKGIIILTYVKFFLFLLVKCYF